MKRTGIIFICGACVLFSAAGRLWAQEENKLGALSKAAIGAQTQQDLYGAIEEIQALYFGEKKYSEFVDFLGSLSQQKKSAQQVIDYFVASTRYEQLRYLEDNQLWDEYFSMGNTYRDDITSGARKAIAAARSKDFLYVYARLVLWRFHNHQQDAFAEEARDSLVKAVNEYSSTKNARTAVIKKAADALHEAGQRSYAQQLYRLYVEKISSEGLEGRELRQLAGTFLSDGNVDLAQSMYELYLATMSDALTDEEKASQFLEIAGMFTYRPDGAYDTAYAELLFQKAHALLGQQSPGEEVLYERALNLQAAQEYSRAQEILEQLIDLFPETPHVEEAQYKIGMFVAYARKDRESSFKHFQAVIQKENAGSDSLRACALYQLGLLHQWQKEFQEAEDFYRKVLKLAQDAFPKVYERASLRLKEMEEGRDIEYNLKTYLDLTFLDEYAGFDMTKVILTAEPQRLSAENKVAVRAQPVLGPTGCFQVDVQYMWSGQLGTSTPTTQQAAFTTAYDTSGVKDINVVVVSPTGFIDRNFILIDVK